MHALHNYYGVPILYTFLDTSHPSVVCLSLRSAGVGIVGVRSAGVRSAGVGHRSREARRRLAFLLVYIILLQCMLDTSLDTILKQVVPQWQVSCTLYCHFTLKHCGLSKRLYIWQVYVNRM